MFGFICHLDTEILELFLRTFCVVVIEKMYKFGLSILILKSWNIIYRYPKPYPSFTIIFPVSWILIANNYFLYDTFHFSNLVEWSRELKSWWSREFTLIILCCLLWCHLLGIYLLVWLSFLNSWNPNSLIQYSLLRHV